MTTLVDAIVKNRWEKEFKDGTDKDYPNIDLVRLEKWFFNSKPGRLIEYGFGSGVNTRHLAKCDYFIDDLPSVLNLLPKNIKKILIDPKKNYNNKTDLLILRGWKSISKIF